MVAPVLPGWVSSDGGGIHFDAMEVDFWVPSGRCVVPCASYGVGCSSQELVPKKIHESLKCH